MSAANSLRIRPHGAAGPACNPTALKSLGGIPAHAGAARMKAPKATRASECVRLEQLPNIGPSLAADLRLIGVHSPRELRGRDPFVLYLSLCAATGRRQDPCVLDTFMAAVDFMRGALAAPWWAYTAERKVLYGQV